jgi:purine-binding chemotaxis protein CheW
MRLPHELRVLRDDPRLAELARARAPREEDRALLHRRALALARIPRAERQRDTLQAIVFVLGGEAWALAAARVLEVFVLRELTPLPGAAAPLFGVTQWRGDVLVLLDLREQLGIRAQGLTDLGRIVVIDGTNHPFGIVVDATSEMIEIETDAIRPVPGSDRRLVRGMLDSGIVVLDEDALLSTYGMQRTTTHASGG